MYGLKDVSVSDLSGLFCILFTKAIEGEAINFIDQSFKTLRSAAAAFDMLLKFKHIRSREAINNQMMQKFNDILTQYCKEVCGFIFGHNYFNS